MEKYDYRKAMMEDVKQYIADNYSETELKEKVMNDREQFEEELNDTLWIVDSVTGNASGSYTFSTWKAEENLCHNTDLLIDALDCFGCDAKDILNGAEYCDVTIRCYLLGEAIDIVLNKLEKEYKKGN